ncbi:hypothetical protein [Jannaschia sp. R86511]|uniref:hypothetical protein n=1 Tax=Jannaschia sp. R86511 TaxID=3093853 RepID=UPI0036D426DF
MARGEGSAGGRGRATAVVLGLAAAVVVGLTLASGAGSVSPLDAAPSAGPSDGGSAAPTGDGSADPAGAVAAAPRLGPEGLAGLVLGEPVDPAVWRTDLETGCVRSLTGLTEELVTLGIGTRVRVETDGDDVVGVTLFELSGRVDAPGTLPDVWLGPTLGDPVADAVALPGARVVTEDPLGDDGPGVTSVVVDTDAGEVVFADPPYDPGTPSGGRISQISVRLGDRPVCRLFDPAQQLQPGQVADPDAPVVAFEVDGLPRLRLGQVVEPDERADLLEPQPDAFAFGPLRDQVRGCDAWATTDGTGASVATDGDGAVVAVGSGLGAAFTTTFGVEPGQPADVAARLLGAEPPAPGAGRQPSADGVAVDGRLRAGTRAVVVTFPEVLTLRTVDAQLVGPLQVAGLTLYRGEAGDSPLC